MTGACRSAAIARATEARDDDGQPSIYAAVAPTTAPVPALTALTNRMVAYLDG